MMSTEQNVPEQKEPVIGVSGVPVDYVTFDLSVKPEPPEEPAKPVPPAASDAPRKAPATAEVPRTETPKTEAPKAEVSEKKTTAPTEDPSAPKSEPVKEPAKDGKTVEIVGVRFKSNGKVYYFDPRGIRAKKGDSAIVETARGQEFGEIALANTHVPESEIVPPIRPMLRVATKEDHLHYAENRKKEEDAFALCLTRIEAHGLDMKLVEAQYTFDNSKLLFYFTSAGRVDFRELVKDLASVFRTRIELRQIGIRDEAKLIGGLGSCGRALCCSGFLSDFGQVSIKMAKEQSLSLNSTKISGTCGRLMCCLRYEYETYLEEIRLSPPVDSTVKTPDGYGTVTEIVPMQEAVKVRLTATPDEPPRLYRRDLLTVFPKGTKLPDEAQPAPAEPTRPARPTRTPNLSEKLPSPAEIEPHRVPSPADRMRPAPDRDPVPALHKKKDEPRAPQKNGKRPPEPSKLPARRDPESERARNHEKQPPKKGAGHPHRRPGAKTQHRGGGKGGQSGS